MTTNNQQDDKMRDSYQLEGRIKYKFGDLIENIAASGDKPTKYGYFISWGRKVSHINPVPYIEYIDTVLGAKHKTPPDNVRLITEANLLTEKQYELLIKIMQFHRDLLPSGSKGATVDQQPYIENAAMWKSEAERLSDLVAEMGKELHQAQAANAKAEKLVEALRLAEEFIVNGVEYGFIHIPRDDPAGNTLPIIRDALTNYQNGEAK